MTLTHGSFKALMDEVDVLARAAITQAMTDVPDVVIGYTRWRPHHKPAPLPHVWNWLANSPARVVDVAHIYDTFDIRMRVGLAYTDQDQRMDLVEFYIDSFRAVLDPALFHQANPLGDTAHRTGRGGMQMVADNFSGVDVLCIEFAISAEVKRQITQ